MRHCKDCKYCIGYGEFAQCTNPSVTEKDITGWPKVKYCDLERWFILGNCGYFGWYYERKEVL